MARNDDHGRDQRNHDAHGTHTPHTGDRDRRRDQVVSSVKEHPYAAAALATVAAGAAAFFLTRGKADKPLMNWGREDPGDNVKGAGAFKPQGSTTSDRSLETASTSPSSSAGLGAGTGGTSPSAVQAATLSSSGSSTSSSAPGATGSSTGGSAATGGTGKAGSSNAATSSTTPGASGASNAGGEVKTGNSGFDETARTETKAGAISYGA